LLINLKVHSSFSKFFDDSSYRFDADVPNDILHYLEGVHPRFRKYMKQIESNDAEESFAFVDEKMRVIGRDAFHIKTFKDGETVYLAPVVAGGGGKRGLFILAAFALVAGPAIFAGAGAGGTALATGIPAGTTSMAGTAASTSAGSGGFFSAFAKLPSFATSLLGNLAMSFISSMFTKKPKNDQQEESTTRQNGMFGSLKNTTQSGTSIALHYGLVRVSGHLLSGYIDTEDHGKSTVVKVEDFFD
jgi:predicted phage tail protein